MISWQPAKAITGSQKSKSKEFWRGALPGFNQLLAVSLIFK
jgi:hypothetical protein